MKTKPHQGASVQLSVILKNDSFAQCNVCKTGVVLRSISKGPYCVRQQLATQMHTTNVIAHSRESDASQSFLNCILKLRQNYPAKSSAFCRSCKTDILLLSRNIMGNLGQHVSYGHLHNSGKNEVTSARDIASLFVPAAKKSSNSADAKRKRSVAYIAPGKQLCQRFYLKMYVYNVNNETGSVIPKQLMHDLERPRGRDFKKD